MRHSAHDGKGGRDVYLDGVLQSRVVWADTKRGRIKLLRYPYVIRNGCLITQFKQGKVEVVFRG